MHQRVEGEGLENLHRDWRVAIFPSAPVIHRSRNFQRSLLSFFFFFLSLPSSRDGLTKRFNFESFPNFYSINLIRFLIRLLLLLF